MQSSSTAVDLVHFAGMLGDLKDDHSRLTLALGALIELLVQKELIGRSELEATLRQMDSLMTRSPYPMA
ncbi:hypothetical protein F4V43_08835 [Paenibacillus spiritus]|uniref:Uncharacterized protein n=1 Tax=Paenibacillus spiritus TaxID=2496557 RepID=A0A5J5GB82_9BACL|nr:hypothetical protein [Paenibacillus spiritus]KAA9005163.1 hypothetical protein F4V43_08835 [Paenibacillus spiritus]